LGDWGFVLRKGALSSLLGVHVLVKFGDDSLSHRVRPSQKVARSWKSHVPAVPALFGRMGGLRGRVSV
jgi:hypothetical protein